MKVEGALVAVVLLSILELHKTTAKANETASKKVMAANPMDAFSNDIYKCMFQHWIQYVGGNKHPVLKDAKSATCVGLGLCYGGPNRMIKKERVAQFAACYNQVTLIPEFTGHLIQPNIPDGGGRDEFREDDSVAPVASDDDYKVNQGPPNPLYDNYNLSAQQFCARGHLTPNADFANNEERSYTMVTTNIAPQWQALNGGNWQRLERALRVYATDAGNPLYVITGTSGEATGTNGQVVKLNKVLAPAWFWKAVCDPFNRQSIFFLARNNIGDKDTVTQEMGCFDTRQTSKWGVITCQSIDSARKLPMEHFQPPIFDNNCNPSVVGEGFNSVIKNAGFQ
ncbi:uncharacterized protein LOC122963281 [Acropora millepora]|uniref:uncharacterized protein LOC122963281 n=1 Tax=Acropora millepora TaxID=45264 RepID=UPI001CF1F3FE|nr:uncharacterized protein LOC122963281 [Acropora millepora]